MEFDAVLFVISAPNLSKRAQDNFQRQTLAATRLPSMLIRLEGTGPNLPQGLDALSNSGARHILVQPLGMPFSESMLAWLPGAIAKWQDNKTVEIALGRTAGTSLDVIAASVAWALQHAGEAIPVRGTTPSLGKRGRQHPPDFTHHLLVCTGPRCHYRDAASLLDALKDETARQGISGDCLTTRSGCLFPCNQGPMVALYPRGEWYRLPDRDSVRRFVTAVLVEGQSLPDLLIHTAKSMKPCNQ